MRVFITGGAGFIGCNSAAHFLKQGYQVTVFDNLSRVGAPLNLAWLQEQFGQRLTFIQGDVRDMPALEKALPHSDVVLHLASQVAVTKSVEDPREDFTINALGTFNLLEAVRRRCPEAVVIYASTNKVYGGMAEIDIVEEETRYAYTDYLQGIPETYPLDFHSPYGCSKGCGDQYSIDYARIYGLKTVVFRQSCIYGQRQFGVEDQGWVAHFIIAAAQGRPITIYGDGKQVRDLLHISDLIRAYELAIERIEQARGMAFNIGGGPEHTISIWREFAPLLTELAGRPPEATYQDWRPGDQRVFVADIGLAARRLGWQPQVSVKEGIGDLYRWVVANRHLFAAG